ncbi:MAG: TetR/AcrR family transcriptional regulator [Treponema sp.]|jgi:AcrR family transcriptional regulator|nr:TetR/AcrR family transcriptional regulator [Treponema sp.]
MAIIVEHEKRRREILKQALIVFVETGFNDATFQKIADRCGIKRTTLYIYFSNKKEIFNYSIKQLMAAIEADILLVRHDTGMASIDKLITVLSVIMDRLEENRTLLSVILDYLVYISKSEVDVDKLVRRRTIRMRHFLVMMVIEGMRAGELASVNARDAGAILYGFLETAIFRLTVLRRPSVSELRQSAALCVKGFAITPPQ